MDGQKIFMIVDDDMDDVAFFCEAMGDNFQDPLIITAEDGADALQKLQSGAFPVPDCIFLDLNMPKMDGKTCLSRLKSDNQLNHIPVIIYTTSSCQRLKKEVKDMGAVELLTKQVSYAKICSDLLHVVQSIQVNS